MRRPQISPEFIEGYALAGIPTMAAALSLPSAFLKSSPDSTHPFRDLDIGSLDNFFDHAGNLPTGAMVLYSMMYAVEKYTLSDNRRHTAYISAITITGATIRGQSFSVFDNQPLNYI